MTGRKAGIFYDDYLDKMKYAIIRCPYCGEEHYMVKESYYVYTAECYRRKNFSRHEKVVVEFLEKEGIIDGFCLRINNYPCKILCIDELNFCESVSIGNTKIYISDGIDIRYNFTLNSTEEMARQYFKKGYFSEKE